MLRKMLFSPAFTYLLIIIAMLLLIYFKNYFRSVFLAFKLPGPPVVPLLGNALLIRESKKLEMLGEKMSELYSPFARVWVSIFPFFILYEPKHLQMILSTNRNNTKNSIYRFLHNFIGDGLITNSGEKWKEHRKLIQPHFHINILKTYFDDFLKCSSLLLEELNNLEDVNIISHANQFSLHVLQHTVLGIPVQNQLESSPYRKGKVFMTYRITRPWLLFDTFFKITKSAQTETEQKFFLKNYTRNILETKRRESFGDSDRANNLMAMLNEISKANPGFTDEDIIAESSTFMLAGQDSVGAALVFSLYFLAAHQDIQSKVMDELCLIFDGSNRAVTFEDVAEMRYLEQCIKETLRLCPSVPMIARQLTEDVTLGKFVVPAGANILISPFATHRLPHIFRDPLKFDPDRFSLENKDNIHPYAYIPFSSGPRNCIGYKFAMIELKTVISEILRTYHVSLTPGHEKLNLLYRVTLKVKDGVWLRLKRRA